MNYLRLFLNLESENKLENREELINIITEVYTAHINSAYMTAEYSSAENHY